MDQEFKDFIVKEHECMDEKTMDSFLDCLANHPDRALIIIKENLIEWIIQASFKLEKSILIRDFDATCQELLDVFTEHFLKNKKIH